MAGPADQEKFEKVGVFFGAENRPRNDHVDHAIHHNFTTKTPPLRTASLQNHPQKHRQRRGFPPMATRHYFF
jgi:hypothetical protein